MINKCPICNAQINGDETLCPYCGSQLKLNKKQDEIKYQSSYTNTTTKPSNQYIPYPQNNNYRPTNYQTPTMNNYNVQNQKIAQTRTKKNAKTALFITIGIMAAMFVFIFILAIIGFSISDDYVGNGLSDNQIKEIINTDVGTDKIPLLNENYIKNVSKVDGNPDMYKNEKCLVYHFVSSEFFDNEDLDSTFYNRNFYIYAPNVAGAKYEGDEYSGSLETDNYSIRFALYSDFDDRHENFYLYDGDTMERLNDIKVNGYIFEIYEKTDEYGEKEYYYISQPIEKDKYYVFGRLTFYSENCDINYKDVILHFDTEKTDK